VARTTLLSLRPLSRDTARQHGNPKRLEKLAALAMIGVEKMRDYISASGSVDREHLETDNVLGPIYKAFGERLRPLMEELNLTLVA
jgi:hypothetical protein